MEKTTTYRETTTTSTGGQGIPRAGGPTAADYRGPSMGQMATSSLGLFPLTPFKMVVGQDTLLLALLGAWICLAPASFLSFANRFSSFMKWPAALVVKSDTSLMLLKVIGATQLAFAGSIMWRMFAKNDAEQGKGLLLMQALITPALILAYFTGGQSHKLLLPFIAHNLATIVMLLFTTNNPFQKTLRGFTASGGAAHVA